MLLNTIIEKLKHPFRNDFKGCQLETLLILQAVSWSLRYPLSDQDMEEIFLELGLKSTTHPWALVDFRG